MSRKHTRTGPVSDDEEMDALRAKRRRVVGGIAIVVAIAFLATRLGLLGYLSTLGH